MQHEYKKNHRTIVWQHLKYSFTKTYYIFNLISVTLTCCIHTTNSTQFSSVSTQHSGAQLNAEQQQHILTLFFNFLNTVQLKFRCICVHNRKYFQWVRKIQPHTHKSLFKGVVLSLVGGVRM